MKKLKVVWGNWLKKIKKWGFIRMLNYKSEIKSLNTKIEEREEEIRKLNDLLYINRIDQEELVNKEIKIASLEQVLEGADKTSKENLNRLLQTTKINEELLTKIFNLELEIKTKNVEIDNYKLQIEDYKTEGRYLVKKLKPDRTKSKIKTKVSKPMANNVVAYMRGEHE